MMKPKDYNQHIDTWLGLWVTTIILAILMVSCHSRQDNTAYQQLSETYQQAHLAQDSALYPQALALYKKCVKESASDKYEKDDSIKLLLPRALVQIVNTYQSIGKPDECIAYLGNLRAMADSKQASHSILNKTFKRDIYVILSYAMSRTDAEKEAASIMDVALTMPLSYPTPERKFRDYSYAAGVYYCVPTYRNKALQYGRLALDEVKLCQKKSGAQWLITVMAKIYQTQGDVGKAIAMCREGFELAEIQKDTLGMANCKKDLADYLYQWEQYDDADKYATQAISLLEKIKNSNPMVVTVAYTIKAKILEQKGNHEEALTFLQKAKECCNSLPYNSGGSDVDLLQGKILTSDTAKVETARYEEGMKLLKKVSQEATYQLRAQAFLELAKASISHGDESYGRVALDSMYSILHTPNPPLKLEGAYEYALSYYIQKDDIANIVRTAKAMNQQRLTDGGRGTLKNIAKSLVRFEMDKQEAEVKQKMKEMEKRKSMEIMGIVCIIIILGCLSCLFAYKYKKKVEKYKEAKQQFYRPKVASVKKTKEKPKASYSPQQLLALKDAPSFKEYFQKTYPYFCAHLKKEIPHLTKKEEHYCMLIALNCSNEALAASFNVARSSVVIAKYRIRKKLKLAQGASMEAYLIGMLKNG